MILRRWRGAVRANEAQAYLVHQDETGIADYRNTPGNRGVIVMHRPVGELVEVVTLSLWEDMDSVKAFAGDDPEVARFYPGDDGLLAERDGHADHWTVHSSDF